MLTFVIDHREGVKFGKTVIYEMEGYEFRVLANRVGVGIQGGMPMTDTEGVDAIIEVLRRAHYHHYHLAAGYATSAPSFLNEDWFETQEWKDAVQEQSPATIHVRPAPADRAPLGTRDQVHPAPAEPRAAEEGPGEGEGPAPTSSLIITPGGRQILIPRLISRRRG